VNTPSVARRRAVKNDPVEVAFVNEAESAENAEAKRLDEVAFVVELFVAAKLFVAVALSTVILVKIPVVPLSVVMVDDEEVRSEIVALVIVVVAKVTVPVAVSAPVDTERNVGAATTLTVEVPVIAIFDPALRLVRAVPTRVFHCEVEAVSGMV
jgi:fumarate reductase subunit D